MLKTNTGETMFVGRKTEMDWLEEIRSHSQKKLFPIVIYGPRRVGKTTLVRKFIEGKKAFYFFVNETKSSPVLAAEAAQEIRAISGSDELLALNSWDKILKYLIEKSPFEVIVFDEFQNFNTADNAVFGILQNLIDQNEHTKKMLVFLGSSTGLMKEVFEDKHAALYGRMKSKLLLKPIAFQEYLAGMQKLGYRDTDDISGFYFVFGGYPKYLSALEDFEIGKKALNEILQVFFFSKNAAFQNEVQDVLRAEFGNKGSNYYSIMEAIGTGHTKLSEISSYTSITATTLSSFMGDLCDYHELVERNLPVLRPKTKDTRYSIKNPLFRFWFRFVRPNLSNMEIGRYDLLMGNIKKNFRAYSGIEFERLAKEYLISQSGNEKLDFSEIGSWWAKGREIDIVTLGKENCVWECKWSSVSQQEAYSIRASLEANAVLAGIQNPKFGLIAKKAERGAEEPFDYFVSIGDIFEGKLPHSKRR